MNRRQVREMQKTPFGRWWLEAHGTSGPTIYESDATAPEVWNAALEWAAAVAATAQGHTRVNSATRVDARSLILAGKEPT